MVVETSLRGEALRTLVADVRFLSEVNPVGVILQISFRVKGEITHGARIPTKFQMDPFVMFFQIELDEELFRADITFERSVIRMNLFVPAQSFLINERSSTHLALKGTFSCVEFLVTFQLKLCFEPHVALVTFVWICITV